MSIATEITRLQTAKSNLITSIENKGVTVPSATKLDGFAALVDQISTGSTPNIQALSVTANGTYTASGGVDGYSPITVNVSGGGASNLVTGTFTFSPSSASAQTVALDYSGSGFPIVCAIVLDDGVLNKTYTNTIARYSTAQWFMTKTYIDQTPTYTTSGDENMGAVATVYKASTSTAATLTRQSNASVNTYSSSNANQTTILCVRFKSNTSMSVYVGANSGTSRYAFFNGMTYRYWIIYSS